jgi:hypothetical protein
MFLLCSLLRLLLPGGCHARGGRRILKRPRHCERARRGPYVAFVAEAPRPRFAHKSRLRLGEAANETSRISRTLRAPSRSAAVARPCPRDRQRPPAWADGSDPPRPALARRGRGARANACAGGADGARLRRQGGRGRCRAASHRAGARGVHRRIRRGGHARPAAPARPLREPRLREKGQGAARHRGASPGARLRRGASVLLESRNSQIERA